MVVINSSVMYQCQTFYIGNGRPEAGKKGVESVQEPLQERYRSDASELQGSDVTVTVTPDVVNIQYSDELMPEFSLPISTLNMCAAVRCVESAIDSTSMKFIPVHSVLSGDEPESNHPAIFTTVMRRSISEGDPLLCHSFICKSARDALHLVNATQTAHSALRRGYTASGTLKLFSEQSSEFDRTINVSGSNYDRVVSATSSGGGAFVRSSITGRNASSSSTGRVSPSKTIHLSYDITDAKNYVTEERNTGNTTYVTTSHDDSVFRRGVSTSNDSSYLVNGTDTTYYVKASEVREPVTPTINQSETILVKSNVQPAKRQVSVPQQTIIVDKPILNPAPPVAIPPPKVIERPVYIDPPPPPKLKQQVIYVDKPVFKESKWPDPPKPQVVERPVIIEPPPPPRQEAQKIIVDKPVIREWPKAPTPPAPIIEENLVYIDPPHWPHQQPQKIIVDKPIVKEIGPPPVPPPPIIEERPVYIDPPAYPEQAPQKIVVEKPVFNPPKPAPPPPEPIIEEKKVYIDPPPYPRQEPQRIIVEKPVIQDPGPPPPPPAPIIIEKPVHIETPRYQQQEPQRIVVEKPVMRDPGPPPPPPKPIIIEKVVYIDPPPWPKQEPQKIIVEKPVFRARPPPTIPKPIIIEKSVYVDAPSPPVVEPQRIVVEKPVLRQMNTVYTAPEVRRAASATAYQYQHRPPNVRSSFVIRTLEPRQGLRRYAWSESGEGKLQQSGAGFHSDTGYRIYGQPRDFRERQFINEKRFSRRVSRDPGVGSYGRIDLDRSSSVSS